MSRRVWPVRTVLALIILLVVLVPLGLASMLPSPPAAPQNLQRGFSPGVRQGLGMSLGAALSDPGWTVEYWANRDLSSDPIKRDRVPALNVDWGLGGPDPAFPDNFSARFTRQVTFAGGPVGFFARSDDGVRLWADEKLLIDRWFSHSADEIYTAAAEFTPGSHTLRVEYYEQTGPASVQVWWLETRPEAQPQPDGDWAAAYWNNQELGGSPTYATTVPELNFEWGPGSPNPAVSSDSFSARFTRTVTLPAGDYRFYARADDGVRLWLDGWKLIDAWGAGSATTYEGDFTGVGAGPHTVQVEYFEQTGDASLRVWWLRPADRGLVDPTPIPNQVGPAIDSPWQGEYFDNADPFGRAVLTRSDPAVSFDWGNTGPTADMPADHFSARWTKTVTLPAGDYEFFAEADDGVRVRFDDNIVLDTWNTEPVGVMRGVVQAVSAGDHRLTVEYYERTGGAAINVRWNQTR